MIVPLVWISEFYTITREDCQSGKQQVGNDTHEWQLQFLRRVRMLHHKLSERLADTLACTFFSRELIVMVIREIEFVPDLGGVCPKTFPRPETIN